MHSPGHSSLASLAERTDDWFARANAALLNQIPCRAGCSHCCIGPFPITRLDVSLIQEGLAALPPAQQEDIERRAREQAAALESAHPALRQSRSLDDWADAEIDRLAGEFHKVPCPALGEQGLCLIYDHRPLACRSMGIPIDEGGSVTGACEVQTFVPIVRLSAALRQEDELLSQQEASALAAHKSRPDEEGEELWLPYGFLHQQ